MNSLYIHFKSSKRLDFKIIKQNIGKFIFANNVNYLIIPNKIKVIPPTMSGRLLDKDWVIV